MSKLFEENILDCIGDWQDPNPTPVITMHEGFVVVRDDLLKSGSKTRFADYFVKNIKQKEIVYGGCPATGYAQISLPTITNRYDKTAVLFMAERKLDNLHEYQQRAIELGAVIHWVKMGMLTVTLKRARDYVEEDPDNRVLLPLGLDHPTVLASIVRVARQIAEPSEFWVAGGSGTINRGLQLAWPNAEANVVQTGHKLTKEQIGNANLHIADLKFDKPVAEEDAPPFPSAPTYDAKVWKFVRQHARPGALFWNVGA